MKISSWVGSPQRTFLVVAIALINSSCANLKTSSQVSEHGAEKRPSTMPAKGAAPVSEASKIVLIYASDLHGQLRPKRGLGGYARLKTLIANERAAADDHTDVVAVLGGDAAGKGQGPCRETNDDACFPLLKDVGVDFSVLGNWELKTSADHLASLLSSSQIQWVGTNVSVAGRGDLRASWTDKKIVEGLKSGLRFAAIGWTTAPSTEELVSGKNYFQIQSKPMNADFSRWDKATAGLPLVWFTHQELDRDRELVDRACATPLGARTLLMLKAHDHEARSEPWACTRIEEPGPFARAVQKVVLGVKEGKLTVLSNERIEMDSHINEDAALTEKIQDLYRKHSPKALETVADVKADLSVDETAHWYADSLRSVTHADVGLVNLGAVKDGFVRGPLLREDLTIALPYNDEIVGLDWNLKDMEKSICAALMRTRDLKDDYGSEPIFAGIKIENGGTKDCRLVSSRKSGSVKIATTMFLIKKSQRWLGKKLEGQQFRFQLNSERAFELRLRKDSQVISK